MICVLFYRHSPLLPQNSYNIPIPCFHGEKYMFFFLFSVLMISRQASFMARASV